MPVIRINVPDAQAQRVVDAFAGLYEIPQVSEDIENPEAPMIDEFTPQQWVIERTRQFIRDTVFRYEKRQALDQVQVESDDSIAEGA